ncbi:aminotransferase class I/II-fold pyridoxal phosphate-dependent enzyme [Streptomyces hypolithicus]
MRRTVDEGRGPVRFTPPAPGTGLPVLPELVAVLAAAAGRTEPEPFGGGPVLRGAAAAYWLRRGLHVDAGCVVVAPGAQTLLFALMAAYGGDVLLPRPCPAWWVPQATMLGRASYHVPTPAECGGVPDPFALLETVRRVRGEGGDPRLLLLCVPDDPTATVAPPELVHEVCEAAVSEGLHIISDETWGDTLHRSQETVFLSPAEMFPADVTVIGDLAGAYTPAAWPVAMARCPLTGPGAALRDRALDHLAATGAVVPGPVAEAAAYALGELEPVTAAVTAGAALYGRVAAAACRAVTASGALARPPQAGRHLYADLGPLRAGLAARGVTDSMDLEEYLSERLGAPVPGGHRFGDEMGALRVRIATAPLIGATPEQRLESIRSASPLQLPHVAGALRAFGSAFDELR